MTYLRFLCWLFFCCYCANALCNPEDAALAAAGIRASDSLQVKINLLLHLFNDRNYLAESSPDPAFQRVATFKSTPRAMAQDLIKKFSKENGSGAGGNPFNPYELGTQRTPSEMLSQRIGGACETYARSFAALLKASGVPSSRIRIVDAVTEDDYRRLCPKGKGSKMNANYKGASGHAMVAVKTDNGQWRIINTSMSPIGASPQVAGTHKGALLNLRNGQHISDISLTQLIRRLDETDVDMASFPDPKTVEQSLNNGKPVQVPILLSLPETVPGPPGQPPTRFRELSVFLITLLEDFPQHTFGERLNLIASGTLTGDICRFDSPSVRTQLAPASSLGVTQ